MKNHSIPQLPKRAILYARVSGDDRKNATSSIKSQLNDCRKYAEQRGYLIAGEFFEDPERATSGADWLPELDKILKLSPSKAFDVVVVREIDRLARNRFKQMSVEIELESHGVVVEYVLGQFAHTSEGRLLKGLMSEFAEYEREKTKERTHRGRLRSVDAGNITIGGSIAPYGYDLVTEIDPITQKPRRRTLVVNEKEAEVVRIIFNLYANELCSLYVIRDYMDEHAIPKPAKGICHQKRTTLKSWSIGTLNSILDSEVYIGRWHYGKTRAYKDAKTGKRQKTAQPREEWIMIPVPAIISTDLFEAVQQRRELNRRQLGHQRKHDYTLGGMVRCGECGNGMSGVTRTHKGGSYSYYKCNSRHIPSRQDLRCNSPLFKTAQLEEGVWNWIKGLIMEPANLRKAIDNFVQQQRDRVQPLLSMVASNEAKVLELEGRKMRLIEAYSKGALSLDELVKQKTPLDKEIEDVAKAVAHLRSELEPQLVSPERLDGIEAIAAEMQEGAADADQDKQAQRTLYQMLDLRVTLSFDGELHRAELTCALGKITLYSELQYKQL